MAMLQQMGLRLPVEIIARLDNLAKQTGRSKTYYAREAILQHLDDLEDLYLAEMRLEDIRVGKSMTSSLEEVEKELGFGLGS
jgi:RHH-type transcriptional regulator, rel operon repressor / antitoxin RelB